MLAMAAVSAVGTAAMAVGSVAMAAGTAATAGGTLATVATVAPVATVVGTAATVTRFLLATTATRPTPMAIQFTAIPRGRPHIRHTHTDIRLTATRRMPGQATIIIVAIPAPRAPAPP